MSKANNLVSVDFETYYDSEYSLRLMSVRNYLHDTRFNAYLVAVYDGEGINYTGSPGGFDWSLLNGRTICAHNASFDEQVYLRLLELKVIRTPVADCQWLCTADLTAWLGVKRDLASASRYLLGEELSKAVRENMKGRTAADCLSDPEVIAYGNRDAIACYRLAEKYLDAWPMPEREISRLNREAGYKGMALDVPLVLRGLTVLNPKLAEAESKLPWVAKGEKPLSPNAAKSYAASLGIPVPASFAKDSEDFQNWLEEYGAKYDWAKAMGDYRSLNTLIGRIQSLRDGRDPKTNRFPYGIRYFGASTGRMSGGSGGDTGGKFNMQNMPRKAMYGVDVRPMFCASRGRKLIVADYNQIEARYLLWRVGNEATLEPIRQGRSVYQAYAEACGLAKPGSDIKHEDDNLYKYCKAACLGAGYGCGGAKFQKVAKLMAGLELTEAESFAAVEDFRARNPQIVRFWREHHDALAYSARCRDETHQVELKSGRILTYWEPRIVGREIEVYQTRGEYKTRMYGGKLTENEVQASCRDILCDAWLACADHGLLPVLNVHDELVFEVEEKAVKESVEAVRHYMTTCSPWAEGLPLGVDINVLDAYAK